MAVAHARLTRSHRWRPHLWSAGPAVMAVGLGSVSAWLGWRGVDFAAQVYRANLFRAYGLTLWDSQWYGGHWTVNYSVLFPPLAGLISIYGAALASAGLGAWCFDRLVIAQFGRRARYGSIVFATGTLVQIVVGQLPFLLGEALALAALLAARGRWWRVAGLLAFAASLASPVAGGFACLGAVAWLCATPRAERWRPAMLALSAGVPILAMDLVFPGQGRVHLFAADLWCILALCALVVVVLPRQERALRVGAALYAVATIGVFLLPNQVGGSVTRLGACVGVPIVACLLSPSKHKLLALAFGVFLIWQWIPAYSAVFGGRSDPAARPEYYSGLLRYVRGHNSPAGRIEVVPTARHWEGALVAPAVPLARGWERQLDTAVNPLFYDPDDLSAASYRTWLLASGVRWVALPDARLDPSGEAEASLLRRGVSGLRPVWRDPHWSLWQVLDSPGIVAGPARLVHLAAGSVVLDAARPGQLGLRVRWTPHWAVTSGRACLAPAPDGWTSVTAEAQGRIELKIRLVGSGPAGCP